MASGDVAFEATGVKVESFRSEAYKAGVNDMVRYVFGITGGTTTIHSKGFSLADVELNLSGVTGTPFPPFESVMDPNKTYKLIVEEV